MTASSGPPGSSGPSGSGPRHHRPSLPGARHFEAVPAGDDPALHAEAAERAAAALVRGVRGSGDAQVVARVVHLAETEGLETLAELWASAPPDTLAGCLWRLYLLRSWVHTDPVGAAREFDRGRRLTPVQEVIAGVVDPPGPAEVRELADAVLRGVVEGDFADTLFRAAAFARVTAVGRADADADADADEGAAWAAGAGGTPSRGGAPAARLLALAEQLEHAGHLELAGDLG